MIPMDIYPGLEGLPAILGKSLYTIQADGSLRPSTEFNKRFERELARFAMDYARNPGTYTLGTIARIVTDWKPGRRFSEEVGVPVAAGLIGPTVFLVFVVSQHIPSSSIPGSPRGARLPGHAEGHSHLEMRVGQREQQQIQQS